MGLFEQFPYTNFHELNLDWVLTTVKSLSEKLDNIQETILAMANAYTDQQVAEVRSDFAQLEADFAAFELDIQKQFSAYTTSQNKAFTDYQNLVNAQVTLMRGEIASAKAEFNTFLAQANEYTDVQIAVAETKFEPIVNKAIPSATVYNILTASYMTIQTMFDYLCSLHNPNAITCGEVFKRNNTCAQISAYAQTCREFLTNGANIIIQA